MVDIFPPPGEVCLVYGVHSSDAFDSYEEYLVDLNLRTAHLERMKPGGWKMELQKNLGDKFDVYNPSMPNKDNAKYAEWKIWFEKIAPLMDDDVILVGHSMGGIFLAKYLSEEPFPKRIRATFLVAAPFETETEYSLADFRLPKSVEGLRKQGGKIFVYHSADDNVVPYADGESYRSVFPESTFRSFTDRGHFNQDRFVEIEEDIRSV